MFLTPNLTRTVAASNLKCGFILMGEYHSDKFHGYEEPRQVIATGNYGDWVILVDEGSNSVTRVLPDYCFEVIG